MNHPRMTFAGRRIAFALGILLAAGLPRRVECGYPGGTCARAIEHFKTCTAYEIEPLGFYAIEWVIGRNVGFAYESGEDCR